MFNKDFSGYPSNFSKTLLELIKLCLSDYEIRPDMKTIWEYLQKIYDVLYKNDEATKQIQLDDIRVKILDHDLKVD